MDVGFPELFRAALNSVERCQVKPDEKVVVYTDSEKNPAVVEAWYAATIARGCDTTLVRATARFPETSPPDAAVAAMTEADMVFDLASNTWLYSPVLPGILESGTRILQVLVPERSIIDRPPVEEILWRAEVAEKLTEGGDEIHITTPEGTDLWAKRQGRPWHAQRGFVWKPGQWDSYGVCMINCSPVEETVHGTIFFNGPMILFPQYCYTTKRPIRAEVEEGRIVHIETEHDEARTFDRWIRQFNDPNVYLVAHIGFGFDPRADLETFDLAGWESYYGGAVTAFGANKTPTLGGSHAAKGHMDGILLNADFFLDGKQIIRGGEFVQESGLLSRP